MSGRTAIALGIAAGITMLSLAWAAPAYAQPALVHADPTPDAVLNVLPAQVTLTFDRALSDLGSWITVSNESGERFDRQDSAVDPANRFNLKTSLRDLPEGRYRVVYNAVSPGSSTVVVGRYEFTVDLPDPQLRMLAPIDGSAPGPRVVVDLQVGQFDFSVYDNRIRLYVDGVLEAELRTLSYTIDLEPGVHEIKTVLARFENEELAETANTAYIAVPRPDPEQEGWEAAASAPPAPGLQLSLPQWGGVVVMTVALLGIGYLIGRRVRIGA